jgi:hypothetical protein
MTAKSPVLASVQAQFPPSANKNVRVVSAWRREDSTLERPEPNGSDGWTSVNQLATYAVLKSLKDRGFTVVNLSTGGVAWGFKDVSIGALI